MIDRIRSLGVRARNRMLWAVFAALVVSGFANAATFQKTDPQHEIELGREIAREVERTEPLSTDKALQDRVKRIGGAIVERLELKVYPYEFKVLAKPDVNAFALPGGFIYLNEGLLSTMQNDNALAFVIAHEVAHAAHRHWATHVEKMDTMNVLGALASVFGGVGGSVIASLTATLTSLKYSRTQENDADKTGIEFMWNSGFDTKGALDAMRALETLEKAKRGPRYLRSHPPTKDRLKQLEALHETLKSRPRPADTTSQASVEQAIDLPKIVGDISAFQIVPNPWFPLDVGNEWVYEVSGQTGRAEYTTRIISVIDANGSKVYRAETSFGKSTTVSFQLLTTANEVRRRSKPTSPDSAWQIEHVIGPSLTEPVTQAGWQYVFVAKEQISTPCGTFSDCVKMRRQGGEPSKTLDLWYAEKVGLVKRTSVETGVTETLIRYTANPPATGTGSQDEPETAPAAAPAPAPEPAPTPSAPQS